MIELVEIHELKITPSHERPPLSYTDKDGTMHRLCGEIPNKNGGWLGQYVPVLNISQPPKTHWFERFLMWLYK